MFSPLSEQEPTGRETVALFLCTLIYGRILTAQVDRIRDWEEGTKETIVDIVIGLWTQPLWGGGNMGKFYFYMLGLVRTSLKCQTWLWHLLLASGMFSIDSELQPAIQRAEPQNHVLCFPPNFRCMYSRPSCY